MGAWLGGYQIPSAGLENPNSPEPEKRGSLVAVTRRYWVPTADLSTFLAALTPGSTDATWTSAVFVGAGVSQAGDTNEVKEVEVRYEPPEWSFTVIPNGTTREADANPLEVPVAKAPGSPSAAEVEDAVADGIEAVLVPMPVYRRTTVTSGSFTWSQANIIGNVGKIDDTPEGMTTPDAERWLNHEHKVTERAGVVTEQTGWQYNPTGWDTTLYDTVP
jgi:hypothetical protein